MAAERCPTGTPGACPPLTAEQVDALEGWAGQLAGYAEDAWRVCAIAAGEGAP